MDSIVKIMSKIKFHIPDGTQFPYGFGMDSRTILGQYPATGENPHAISNKWLYNLCLKTSNNRTVIILGGRLFYDLIALMIRKVLVKNLDPLL